MIWHFHYRPEPVIHKKTNNWAGDEFYTLARDTVMWHWSADTHFESRQFLVGSLSRVIKLYQNCVKAVRAYCRIVICVTICSHV